MAFFLDFTPLIAIAFVLGFAIGYAICYLFYLLFRHYLYIPLKHWKTGLKLYRFEKQAYNKRVIEERWFVDDNAAKRYQCWGDFYPFCTSQIYPRLKS